MDLSIYRCGYEKRCPLQIKQYESGGHYLFCYIISGRGVLRIEKEPSCLHALSEKTGFLIGPEENSEVSPDGEWEYVWVEFGGLRAEEYVSISGLSSDQPVYFPEDPRGGDELFSSMMELVRSEEECPLRTTGYLYLFMDSLIRTSKFRRQATEGRTSEEYVEGAVRYIKQNYFRHISVEELARQCWLDRSYFGKVFKSITGQSPQRFLISFRMERAAAELTASNAPIGDVGASVGYPNLLHFSRAFKGVYGMSPREYRQQYKKQTRREAIQ
ncbi:AraC family transcriptional regulator [Sporofaciens musculi]|jgi:AraC-like DNA-binding protein|uniref:AraC family transcriptional regulator n=1 Tax=Sporofaciens musculi TaxID=2681861 RepID=UPI0025A2F7A5|nr:AraC family transcriptional regulator [Sporofaciens musculi]